MKWSSKNDFPQSHYSKYSNKQVYWECDLGHTFLRTFNKQTENSKCPICSNRELLQGFNDLETKYPELAKEWHEDNVLKPNEVVYGSSKIVKWKCINNHVWTERIVDRLNKTCPYCKHMPDKVSKYIISDITGLSKYSKQKVQLQCENNHIWERQFVYVNSNDVKCPYCTNKELLKGFNDAKTIYPNLEQDYNDTRFTFNEILFTYSKKLNWKCSNNHNYKMTLQEKLTNKCPICFPIDNLQSKFPNIAKQWHKDKITNYHLIKFIT